MLLRFFLLFALFIVSNVAVAGHNWSLFSEQKDHCCSKGYECSDTCFEGKLYDVFMPEYPVIFDPLIADPRQVVYSIGWRYSDENLETHLIDVSYGSTFPFYRAWNFLSCGDVLQLELEGCLWAVFDHMHYSAPLINADYYVGLPLTYRLNRCSLRLRFYHISSHLGDEFLLNHPEFDRRNPSAEYLDLIGSYDLCDGVRLYGGYGYIINSDESFKVDPHYFIVGGECYFPCWGFKNLRHCIKGEPFFAIHLQLSQENDFNQDLTIVLGYEFQKLAGLCRKLRLYFEYHDGCSPDGQFCRFQTQYCSLRASYGF